MTTDAPPRRPRVTFRTVFIVIGVTAVFFLLFQAVSFVQEARVVVNIGTDSTDTPQQRIVNKDVFTPPADGMLRLEQLSMMLHIVESADTITSSQPETSRTTRIVEMLNEYTTSLSEYRWVRSTIAQELRRKNVRTAAAASPFGKYEPLLMQAFARHRKYFLDSLDRQLL